MINAPTYMRLNDPMSSDQVFQIRTLHLRLSQQHLAELIGVTPQTVSRWERGKTKCTGLPARVLWLLAWSDNLGPFTNTQNEQTLLDMFSFIRDYDP